VAGRAVQDRVRPYGLVLHLDDLFVVGHSHRAGAIRIFKVSRIRAVKPARRSFTRPRDFRLEELFRSSFGIIRSAGKPTEIVVAVQGRSRRRGRGADLARQPEARMAARRSSLFEPGSGEPEALIATFRLSEVTEFKRWLKGFGDQAVVLKPAWLRRELRAELMAAAQQYE